LFIALEESSKQKNLQHLDKRLRVWALILQRDLKVIGFFAYCKNKNLTVQMKLHS
jgi:hypothetical protein